VTSARDRAYYMACLDLEGRSVLVVGGGRVALEKVRGLLASGARVTVVAPRIHAELRDLDVEWLPRRYERDDLAGRHLVVAATSSEAVNAAVSREAERRYLFCNVVDEPTSAPRSCRRCTGRGRSPSPSRRRARRPRSRSGSGMTSPP
jgi:siroheme synthase-like protein